MKYKVELTKSAEKELLRLPTKDQQRVSNVLLELRDNPRPHGYKKLKGEDSLYRVRIGNYRAIYTIKDHILLVLVLDIGHRKDIYG